MIIIAKRTNGEGTIYQRPNGLWCAELTIGYDSEGKRIKKSFSSMELEKLQKKLNDEKFKLNRNIITQKNDYTISEWVQFWLENYKSDLKSKTYDNYEYALNSHIKNTIGHYRLDKIRPDAVQQLYNNMRKKNLSTSTIKKVHITLNQAFEQAIKNEFMYSNPCRAVTVPRIEKKKVISMSNSEQELFIKNCPNTTYGNFFQFALNTGMRCGEIIALTWADVDFENKTIDVNKTASTVKNRDGGAETKTKIVIDSAKTEKSMRSIPMNKQSEKILMEQRTKKENDMLVFSSKVSTILIARNINRALDDVLTKAGLPKSIGIHALRHSFATRLLEKGANAKVVSDILGHSSIQVTLDIYSHVMPNMKKDVINLLD